MKGFHDSDVAMELCPLSDTLCNKVPRYATEIYSQKDVIYEYIANELWNTSLFDTYTAVLQKVSPLFVLLLRVFLMFDRLTRKYRREIKNQKRKQRRNLKESDVK